MQVSKLKGHWENIVDNSGVWRGQIDYLMEEWKRFVELREELLEWIRKAEAYLERDENVYGFTVSELEEQIDKHKVKQKLEAYTPEGRGDGRLPPDASPFRFMYGFNNTGQNCSGSTLHIKKLKQAKRRE